MLLDAVGRPCAESPLEVAAGGLPGVLKVAESVVRGGPMAEVTGGAVMARKVDACVVWVPRSSDEVRPSVAV